MLDLAKVLCLPHNSNPWEKLTLRKCCACHATQTLETYDLAKVLRLPRNLHLTLRKCCACHVIESLRNLRVAVLIGRRSEYGPNALRMRSECAPRVVRPGATNRSAFGSPKTPIYARRYVFCSFLYSYLTHAYIFSRAYSFFSSVLARVDFELIVITRKFLLNFL